MLPGQNTVSAGRKGPLVFLRGLEKCPAVSFTDVLWAVKVTLYKLMDLRVC